MYTSHDTLQTTSSMDEVFLVELNRFCCSIARGYVGYQDWNLMLLADPGVLDKCALVDIAKDKCQWIWNGHSLLLFPKNLHCCKPGVCDYQFCLYRCCCKSLSVYNNSVRVMYCSLTKSLSVRDVYSFLIVSILYVLYFTQLVICCELLCLFNNYCSLSSMLLFDAISY